VLLDADGNCKLIDFGLSKESYTEGSVMGSVLGTVAYMPPEIALEQPYTRKCDCYSLGAFLYEMLTGLPPYYAKTREKIIENIRKAPLEIPREASTPVKDLLNGLLDRDVERRLSIADIKGH
jgi:serine/threonine protein kinase